MTESPRHDRPHTFLSRLTRAVGEQNWFAVVLEVAILIVGVVVGFQVTEWGDERAAREEEQELLRGLQAEFGEVLSGLGEQVGRHERVERAVSTTLEALGKAEESGASSASVSDTTLAWALVPATTQFGQGVLDGMLTTGRLSLIGDPALRAALSEWEGVLADVTEDELASREIVVTQLEPLLWRIMDVQRIRTYELLDTTIPMDRGTATEVPVDAELMGVLATRRFWLHHTIREFSGPQVEAERILDLIERSLDGAGR